MSVSSPLGGDAGPLTDYALAKQRLAERSRELTQQQPQAPLMQPQPAAVVAPEMPPGDPLESIEALLAQSERLMTQTMAIPGRGAYTTSKRAYHQLRTVAVNDATAEDYVNSPGGGAVVGKSRLPVAGVNGGGAPVTTQYPGAHVQQGQMLTASSSGVLNHGAATCCSSAPLPHSSTGSLVVNHVASGGGAATSSTATSNTSYGIPAASLSSTMSGGQLLGAPPGGGLHLSSSSISATAAPGALASSRNHARLMIQPPSTRPLMGSTPPKLTTPGMSLSTTMPIVTAKLSPKIEHRGQIAAPSTAASTGSQIMASGAGGFNLPASVAAAMATTNTAMGGMTRTTSGAIAGIDAVGAIPDEYGVDESMAVSSNLHVPLLAASCVQSSEEEPVTASSSMPGSDGEPHQASGIVPEGAIYRSGFTPALESVPEEKSNVGSPVKQTDQAHATTGRRIVATSSSFVEQQPQDPGITAAEQQQHIVQTYAGAKIVPQDMLSPVEECAGEKGFSAGVPEEAVVQAQQEDPEVPLPQAQAAQMNLPPVRGAAGSYAGNKSSSSSSKRAQSQSRDHVDSEEDGPSAVPHTGASSRPRLKRKAPTDTRPPLRTGSAPGAGDSRTSQPPSKGAVSSSSSGGTTRGGNSNSYSTAYSRRKAAAASGGGHHSTTSDNHQKEAATSSCAPGPASEHAGSASEDDVFTLAERVRQQRGEEQRPLFHFMAMSELFSDANPNARRTKLMSGRDARVTKMWLEAGLMHPKLRELNEAAARTGMDNVSKLQTLLEMTDTFWFGSYEAPIEHEVEEEERNGVAPSGEKPVIYYAAGLYVAEQLKHLAHIEDGNEKATGIILHFVLNESAEKFRVNNAKTWLENTLALHLQQTETHSAQQTQEGQIPGQQQQQVLEDGGYGRIGIDEEMDHDASMQQGQPRMRRNEHDAQIEHGFTPATTSSRAPLAERPVLLSSADNSACSASEDVVSAAALPSQQHQHENAGSTIIRPPAPALHTAASSGGAFLSAVSASTFEQDPQQAARDEDILAELAEAATQQDHGVFSTSEEERDSLFLSLQEANGDNNGKNNEPLSSTTSGEQVVGRKITDHQPGRPLLCDPIVKTLPSDHGSRGEENDTPVPGFENEKTATGTAQLHYPEPSTSSGLLFNKNAGAMAMAPPPVIGPPQPQPPLLQPTGAMSQVLPIPKPGSISTGNIEPAPARDVELIENNQATGGTWNRTMDGSQMTATREAQPPLSPSQVSYQQKIERAMGVASGESPLRKDSFFEEAARQKLWVSEKEWENHGFPGFPGDWHPRDFSELRNVPDRERSPVFDERRSAAEADYLKRMVVGRRKKLLEEHCYRLSHGAFAVKHKSDAAISDSMANAILCSPKVQTSQTGLDAGSSWVPEDGIASSIAGGHQDLQASGIMKLPSPAKPEDWASVDEVVVRGMMARGHSSGSTPTRTINERGSGGRLPNTTSDAACSPRTKALAAQRAASCRGESPGPDGAQLGLGSSQYSSSPFQQPNSLHSMSQQQQTGGPGSSPGMLARKLGMGSYEQAKPARALVTGGGAAPPFCIDATTTATTGTGGGSASVSNQNHAALRPPRAPPSSGASSARARGPPNCGQPLASSKSRARSSSARGAKDRAAGQGQLAVSSSQSSSSSSRGTNPTLNVVHRVEVNAASPSGSASSSATQRPRTAVQQSSSATDLRAGSVGRTGEARTGSQHRSSSASGGDKIKMLPPNGNHRGTNTTTMNMSPRLLKNGSTTRRGASVSAPSSSSKTGQGNAGTRGASATRAQEQASSSQYANVMAPRRILPPGGGGGNSTMTSSSSSTGKHRQPQLEELWSKDSLDDSGAIALSADMVSPKASPSRQINRALQTGNIVGGGGSKNLVAQAFRQRAASPSVGGVRGGASVRQLSARTRTREGSQTRRSVSPSVAADIEQLRGMEHIIQQSQNLRSRILDVTRESQRVKEQSRVVGAISPSASAVSSKQGVLTRGGLVVQQGGSSFHGSFDMTNSTKNEQESSRGQGGPQKNMKRGSPSGGSSSSSSCRNLNPAVMRACSPSIRERAAAVESSSAALAAAHVQLSDRYFEENLQRLKNGGASAMLNNSCERTHNNMHGSGSSSTSEQFIAQQQDHDVGAGSSCSVVRSDAALSTRTRAGAGGKLSTSSSSSERVSSTTGSRIRHRSSRGGEQRSLRLNNNASSITEEQEIEEGAVLEATEDVWSQLEGVRAELERARPKTLVKRGSEPTATTGAGGHILLQDQAKSFYPEQRTHLEERSQSSNMTGNSYMIAGGGNRVLEVETAQGHQASSRKPPGESVVPSTAVPANAISSGSSKQSTRVVLDSSGAASAGGSKRSTHSKQETSFCPQDRTSSSGQAGAHHHGAAPILVPPVVAPNLAAMSALEVDQLLAAGKAMISDPIITSQPNKSKSTKSTSSSGTVSDGTSATASTAVVLTTSNATRTTARTTAVSVSSNGSNVGLRGHVGAALPPSTLSSKGTTSDVPPEQEIAAPTATSRRVKTESATRASVVGSYMVGTPEVPGAGMSQKSITATSSHASGPDINQVYGSDWVASMKMLTPGTPGVELSSSFHPRAGAVGQTKKGDEAVDGWFG
ncbi:unnamed protein product [Amoebophrya sp. A25]|nr:unnamed protein product [Amoebophrya sp. A25]|eukprot:GSA25T00014063001.1